MTKSCRKQSPAWMRSHDATGSVPSGEFSQPYFVGSSRVPPCSGFYNLAAPSHKRSQQGLLRGYLILIMSWESGTAYIAQDSRHRAKDSGAVTVGISCDPHIRCDLGCRSPHQKNTMESKPHTSAQPQHERPKWFQTGCWGVLHYMFTMFTKGRIERFGYFPRPRKNLKRQRETERERERQRQRQRQRERERPTHRHK